MKKLFLLAAFIFPMLVSAQVITYDTIRVSPDDARNINRVQRERTYSQPAPQQQQQQPVRLQEKPVMGFDRSKLRFGANIGLSFSRNYTVFTLGPQVGYQFNKYFMGGAGIKYYYNKVRAYGYNEEYLYKNHLLGPNVFGYFYPVNFLVVFAQPELNYLWSNVTNVTAGTTSKDSGFVPSLLVGAGLRLGRSHITLNYDLVNHTNSPYPDRVFLGVSAFF